MGKYYDTLIYFLHSDNNNFEDCVDLDHVIERASSCARLHLSNNGILNGDNEREVGEDMERFVTYVKSSWVDYDHFWSDVYD